MWKYLPPLFCFVMSEARSNMGLFRLISPRWKLTLLRISLFVLCGWSKAKYCIDVIRNNRLSSWTVNVILNMHFKVTPRNDIFVREIILFLSVIGTQDALLVETPCEILPYCSFLADIVVRYTPTGQWRTGYRTRSISVYKAADVCRTRNRQENNCRQQKLPIFYNNLKSTFYNKR